MLKQPNTRITIDLGQPQLITFLKIESAQTGQPVKEIVALALQNYFAEKLENKALAKLSEKAFAEWNNTEDAIYDSL